MEKDIELPQSVVDHEHLRTLLGNRIAVDAVFDRCAPVVQAKLGITSRAFKSRFMLMCEVSAPEATFKDSQTRCYMHVSCDPQTVTVGQHWVDATQADATLFFSPEQWEYDDRMALKLVAEIKASDLFEAMWNAHGKALSRARPVARDSCRSEDPCGEAERAIFDTVFSMAEANDHSVADLGTDVANRAMRLPVEFVRLLVLRGGVHRAEQMREHPHFQAGMRFARKKVRFGLSGYEELQFEALCRSVGDRKRPPLDASDLCELARVEAAN
jgi:hypothetical protein